MTDDLDRAFDEAANGGLGFADALAERLAEKVGARAGARLVFGDPVERDGVTVIPVAKVRYGFGAGGGSGTDESGEASGSGGGGGGGVAASPAGYIEISGGTATFRQISDPVSMWPLVVAGGFASWLVLRGLRALVRR
ncbi:MAG: hypothetical protein Kow0010_24760 [Dehalococcoidia bacterium]